jgi:hypothetical protein
MIDSLLVTTQFIVMLFELDLQTAKMILTVWDCKTQVLNSPNKDATIFLNLVQLSLESF